METPQTNINDWRKEITPTSDTIKLKDGDTMAWTFADEGSRRESKDFGSSIAFQVILENTTTPKTFFVPCRNFNLLSQIKQLGTLTGVKIKITRIGSLKSDTRYKIYKL